MQTVKLVVVGDDGVGKTCLLISYTTNSFPQEYVPTVFDDYSANIIVNEIVVNLGLWDTAGNEEYDKLRVLSYPGTNVFLILYSVASRTSFENVKKRWQPELQTNCPGVPVFLVATKIDLQTSEVQVTSTEGEKMAKEIKAAAFVECSALKQTGVTNLFNRAIGTLFKPNAGAPPPSAKKASTCFIM